MGKIIIIAVVVVAVLAGGAVALRFVAPGLIPGWGEKAAAPDAATQAESAGKEADKMLVLVPLQSFIVNLADPGGKRYLKLTLTLEVRDAVIQGEVNSHLPQIRDSILLLLSSLTFEEISTVGGKDALRAKIKSRCNTVLASSGGIPKVHNIYFSEFVVQ
ncbi:MAG: flagellar basal body-associated FliL family protein [Proteobacteria bacterium]|nr:flagellar basal body-associated FliL family protein [Pseudomonadota bacterium]